MVVNCYMGLSRSASVVIAYLMTKHNMSLDRVSHSHLQLISPTNNFHHNLIDLRHKLKEIF